MSHRFRSGSLELTYEVAGDIRRPPLLMLHNACSTFGATFRGVLGPLSRQFRLVGPDLRGHGHSNNPDDRLDLRQMADDLAALLDHLTLPTVHVLAFSGGASVALYLITRHPRRMDAQVLIGSHYTIRGLVTRGNAFWDARRIQHEQPAWWAAMLAMHGSDARVRALLRWWQEEDHYRPDFSMEELAAITAPTLLIVGAGDLITPVDQTRKMAARMPRARLIEFAGTGHDVMRERPDEFLTTVEGFWREIGAIKGPETRKLT